MRCPRVFCPENVSLLGALCFGMTRPRPHCSSHCGISQKQSVSKRWACKHARIARIERDEEQEHAQYPARCAATSSCRQHLKKPSAGSFRACDHHATMLSACIFAVHLSTRIPSSLMTTLMRKRMMRKDFLTQEQALYPGHL